MAVHKCAHRQRALFGRRGRSDGSTSARRLGLHHRPRATPDYHRRLGACRAVAARHITRSLRSSRPGVSCLTRPGHRRIVWPHEIPDSGISYRNAGSSPRSCTEASDIFPVFAALEHAAGDFTTLGTNPLLGGSSPPRTHNFPISARFRACRVVTRGAGCRQRRAIGVPVSVFLPGQGFAAGFSLLLQ